MLFSSLVFLYAFLPIVLILNFLIRKEFRNRLLLIASLIFFAWGGVSYSIILIISLLINYFVGIYIGKFKGTFKSKLSLTIGILLNLLLLGVFKYANFIVENLNIFNDILGWKPIEDPGIILPLGISFYTFQAMSYIIDVYRNEAKVQKNFFKLSLFISFFPQLIAGPIVRYQYIEDQLSKRKNHFANLSYGIQRFILGLSKKVLLANQFGIVVDEIFVVPFSELNSVYAWIGVLAYSMQIYYDFSGYSDMAIGLGRMFGFKLPENFNFPYISRSIREFWNRWHMTLGQWFKNYLYFPLGGSKKGPYRTIINLLLVFLATSIWHGASWNFVVWGMAHGFIMMFERLGLEKFLRKVWKPIQYIYTFLFVSVSWVFFRIEDFNYAWGLFKKLFSFEFTQIDTTQIPAVSNPIFIIVSIIGILSATPFWEKLIEYFLKYYKSLEYNKLKYTINTTSHLFIALLVMTGIFLCTMLLISNTYNPFIYFRF